MGQMNIGTHASCTENEATRFALPATVRERYYTAGYWRREDLWDSFAAVVVRHPQATAFIEGDRKIRFDELMHNAASFGRALRARGLQPGDVVAIHGRHCLESVVAIMGCACAGFVVALLPHMFGTEQIGAILDNAAARALIALGEESEVQRAAEAVRGRGLLAFVVADFSGSSIPTGASACSWRALMQLPPPASVAREPRAAEDLALLLFSSGTTGEPKGVMHSANTVRFTVETYARYHEIRPSDTSLVLTAFGFVGSSILGTYLTFFAGCRTVLQRTWAPEKALALIERHRVTHLLLMPTHAIDILASASLDRTDCSSVSRGVVAGLSEVQRLDARRRVCARPYPMYGMSESPAHVTGCASDDWEVLRTTEGRAIPGTELLVCTDDDQPVAAGVPGNVLVRGPNRFVGYYRNDALNRDSLTGDGFFRTGDVGMLSASGYFTFVSRSKDIIRRGGVTITPADLEAALRCHPRVADVAVIAVPDPRLGERACACIIARDGPEITLGELTAFLEARGVARYLWPEHVALCASFPRTPSLKVQKNELRKQVLAQIEAAGTPPS
jgi:acyl-CoA synthetase (AMP-forming)/AMP-acid ligase II